MLIPFSFRVDALFTDIMPGRSLDNLLFVFAKAIPAVTTVQRFRVTNDRSAGSMLEDRMYTLCILFSTPKKFMQYHAVEGIG